MKKVINILYKCPKCNKPELPKNIVSHKCKQYVTKNLKFVRLLKQNIMAQLEWQRENVCSGGPGGCLGSAIELKPIFKVINETYEQITQGTSQN